MVRRSAKLSHKRQRESKGQDALQASFEFDNVEDPKAWKQYEEKEWPDSQSEYRDGKKWYKANKDILAEDFSGRKLAIDSNGVVMAQARYFRSVLT